MPANAQRAFSQAEIDAFAAASGDFNPIHVDPLAARRLIGGATLVHGVHALLWALEGSLASRPRRLVALDASFRQAIRVGEAVACTAQDSGDRLHLEVQAEGRVTLTAEVSLGQARPGAAATFGRPGRGESRRRSAADLEYARGSIPIAVDVAALRRLLPSLTLPEDQLAALVSVSRLVGMECPGHDSLLHHIVLRWTGEGASALDYRTERFDTRFRSLRLRVEATGVEGRVEAFLRPGPAEQPSTTALASRLTAGEFAGERALVVGGSRGLGEVSAKLLGAGGADVRLTYVAGRDDAERVCDEIREAGGRAQAVAFDVMQEDARLDSLGPWPPTMVCYFPTPRISLNETTRFVPALFRLYCAYYVEGLLRTVDAALALSPAQLAVFYPSTTALDEVLPKAMEYAAAKGAGEVACRHLEKLDRRLHVRVTRLPRVRTDTTASVLPVEAQEAADVMLPELRALRAALPSRGKASPEPR